MSQKQDLNQKRSSKIGPKFAISNLTLTPRFRFLLAAAMGKIFPWLHVSSNQAAKLMTKLGLEHIQLSPLRGWDIANVAKSGLSVVVTENPWYDQGSKNIRLLNSNIFGPDAYERLALINQAFSNAFKVDQVMSIVSSSWIKGKLKQVKKLISDYDRNLVEVAGAPDGGVATDRDVSGYVVCDLLHIRELVQGRKAVMKSHIHVLLQNIMPKLAKKLGVVSQEMPSIDEQIDILEQAAKLAENGHIKVVQVQSRCIYEIQDFTDSRGFLWEQCITLKKSLGDQISGMPIVVELPPWLTFQQKKKLVNAVKCVFS